MRVIIFSFLLLFPLLSLGQITAFNASFSTGQFPGWDKMMNSHVAQVPSIEKGLNRNARGLSLSFSYYSKQNRIGYILAYRFHQNYTNYQLNEVGWENHMVSAGVIGPVYDMPIGTTQLHLTPGLVLHFPQASYVFRSRIIDNEIRWVDTQGFGAGVDLNAELQVWRPNRLGLFLTQHFHYTPFIKVFNLHRELDNRGIPEIIDTTSFWEYRIGLALKIFSDKKTVVE